MLLLVGWQKKVKDREYASMYDFRRDVELMVTNAKTYNPPGTVVHIFGGDMMTLFESLWAAFLKDYGVVDIPPTQHQV